MTAMSARKTPPAGSRTYQIPRPASSGAAASASAASARASAAVRAEVARLRRSAARALGISATAAAKPSGTARTAIARTASVTEPSQQVGVPRADLAVDLLGAVSYTHLTLPTIY